MISEIFGLTSKEEFVFISQLSSLQPDGPFNEANYRLSGCRRKSGEDFPAEVLLSAFNYQERGVLQATVRDISERKQAEESIRNSYAKLRRTLEKTAFALSSALEMRDAYTAGHQRRVTQLACAIAREIGISENQIEGIRIAGILHDIGKIFIPAEILSKPGKLNKLEFELIKKPCKCRL
ncbi:MAG: HD domain-containing protein [Candidatus Brocadiaceae bacterium]